MLLAIRTFVCEVSEMKSSHLSAGRVAKGVFKNALWAMNTLLTLFFCRPPPQIPKFWPQPTTTLSRFDNRWGSTGIFLFCRERHASDAFPCLPGLIDQRLISGKNTFCSKSGVVTHSSTSSAIPSPSSVSRSSIGKKSRPSSLAAAMALVAPD